MSNGVKKRSNRQLILRTLGALVIGFSVVYIFVTLLSSYGTLSDNLPLVAAKHDKFPENEQALDDMAADLARKGGVLSKVEPAAGVSKQKPVEKKQAAPQ